MRDYLAHEVRNVVVMGHSGSGKTAVLSSMLHETNSSERFGKSKEGNSLIDFDAEEIRRGISIYMSLIPIEWKDCKINFMDTPGYQDFCGECETGLAAADNALIVVGAKEGIQSGTFKAWEHAKEKKLPTIFFVNKIDEEHASFDMAYQQLREAFGKAVIPFEIPIIEEEEVIGSVNILKNKAWYFKGALADETTSYPVPEAMAEQVKNYKDQIAEAVAMADDELMEKFFSGEEFSDADLTRGVRVGVRNGEIRPVFSGSAIHHVGIQRLLDLILKYFPAYGEAGTYEALNLSNQTPVLLQTNEKEKLSALVFKTIIDPFIGRISYVKVLSGILVSDSIVYNSRKDTMERINQIFIIKGKHQTAVGKLFTGDIGAVVKLQMTQTNDTLCDKELSAAAKEIMFSKPMLSMAVYPKSKQDENKMSTSLKRMCEEDQTLCYDYIQEIHQSVLYGIGDQHFEVVTAKLKTKYKLDVILKTPKVPYRETIQKKAVGEGRYKKQSGGHGQFGHVIVEFEPHPKHNDMVFEERVFGGAVPKQYFPAVEIGLRECMETGILAGYKMVNVKATLLDGKYHDVDSSEMAFKQAAHLAYKDGMHHAQPMLLEPIVNVMVKIPDEFTGAIIGDFHKRRGSIMGMDMNEGYQLVHVQVPYAEMLRYPIELRAMTQGRGSYEQTFERYDPVPQHLSDQIVRQTQNEAE